MPSPRWDRLTALGRRYLLYAVISALVAAGLSFLMNLGDSVDLLVIGCLGAAVIGVGVCTVIFGLQHAVSLWLEKSERLARMNPRLLSAAAFVVGGPVGFLLGGEVAKAIFPGFTTTPPVGEGRFLAFMGLVNGD